MPARDTLVSQALWITSPEQRARVCDAFAVLPLLRSKEER